MNGSRVGYNVNKGGKVEKQGCFPKQQVAVY